MIILGTYIFIIQTVNKGGVQIVNSIEELKKVANAMLNNTLVTKQTGKKGKKVNGIYFFKKGSIDE